MVAGKFLYARSVDELILDCYRLGKFYGVDPDIFLAKPLSIMFHHIGWTNRLIERMSVESSIDYG